jgi:hypothetical protein
MVKGLVKTESIADVSDIPFKYTRSLLTPQDANKTIVAIVITTI